MPGRALSPGRAVQGVFGMLGEDLRAAAHPRKDRPVPPEVRRLAQVTTNTRVRRRAYMGVWREYLSRSERRSKIRRPGADGGRCRAASPQEVAPRGAGSYHRLVNWKLKRIAGSRS